MNINIPFHFSGILDGKHYNRCIKAHKCMFEALARCYWQEFRKWLENEEMEFRLENLSHALVEFRSTLGVANIDIELPDTHEKLKVIIN